MAHLALGTVKYILYLLLIFHNVICITRTRVFVYTWIRASTPDSDRLLDIVPLTDKNGDPVQLKVEPGLSTFGNDIYNLIYKYQSNLADNIPGVIPYLTPLLELASSNIPADRHEDTVLYMLATAGMRMISEHDQNAIFDEIRTKIPEVSNFLFTPEHAGTISGKEEGVFAWISANYVLGRLKVKLP